METKTSVTFDRMVLCLKANSLVFLSTLIKLFKSDCVMTGNVGSPNCSFSMYRHFNTYHLNKNMWLYIKRNCSSLFAVSFISSHSPRLHKVLCHLLNGNYNIGDYCSNVFILNGILSYVPISFIKTMSK